MIFGPAISRRAFLSGGTAVGASLLLDQKVEAEGFGAVDGPLLKEYDIPTNGISLHVTEQGQGPAVLFCHGFPDTSYTWCRQMRAIASAGAAEPYFYLSAAWKGAKIAQPSFYVGGKADGLGALYPPIETLRAGLPGLVGNLELDNVGHWVQHEASAEVSDQLVKFLHTVNPA